MRMDHCILFVVLVAACDSGPTGVGFQESAERRMAWSRLGITDYSITRERSAFGSDPLIRITVRGGEITNATLVSDGSAVDARLRASLRTIDGTFDLINEVSDQGVYGLNVQYDPVRNFPTSVAVDPQHNVADDEYGIELSDFAMP